MNIFMRNSVMTFFAAIFFTAIAYASEDVVILLNDAAGNSQMVIKSSPSEANVVTFDSQGDVDLEGSITAPDITVQYGVVGGTGAFSQDVYLATSTGNVGIKTTNPNQKLEVVNGNIKANYGVNAATGVFSATSDYGLKVSSGGSYVLEWSTIDGGGGTSSGGQYIVMGTIAQHDAAVSAGGPYELLGGFWPGGPSCIVEFEDFARFAQYWLETPCNAGNNWCGGADLDELGDVDFIDAGQFADEWLELCSTDWPLR